MRNHKLLVQLSLIAAATLASSVLSGCQEAGQAPVASQKLAPIFYPEPPEKPRLQLLLSISREQDLAVRNSQKRSALEAFVLGDEEDRRGRIVKPYGIAVHEGKIYVCDVGKRMVQVIDIREGTFTNLTKDRRLRNPAHIFIEPDGTKYVADAVAEAIFVFDANDTLRSILRAKPPGKNDTVKAALGDKPEMRFQPQGLAVRGNRCYVADYASAQVVVMDKVSGEEILRMGKRGEGDGEFRQIAGLSLDDLENVYVTDKLLGRITKFDKNGVFQATIAKHGYCLSCLTRSKGIAVDAKQRLWVVDSGIEVGKIFDAEGRLLMIYGEPGAKPGDMLLPAGLTVDYGSVDLFRDYFAQGTEIEFLVLVSNQLGPHAISVYGFILGSDE